MLVRPEPETPRVLSWRPGWGVCLGTPAWRGRSSLRARVPGRPCAPFSPTPLSSATRSRQPSSTRSGSGARTGARSRRESPQPRRGRALRRPAHAPGPPRRPGTSFGMSGDEANLELNVAARPGLQAADDATFLKLAVKDVAAGHRQLPGEDRRGRRGLEWARAPVVLERRRERLCVRSRGQSCRPRSPGRSRGCSIVCRRHRSFSIRRSTRAKRLVPGYFAPVNASWGIENRSAAVRVIRSERLPAAASSAGGGPGRTQTRISRWPPWSRQRSTASGARPSHPRPSRATRVRAL